MTIPTRRRRPRFLRSAVKKVVDDQPALWILRWLAQDGAVPRYAESSRGDEIYGRAGIVVNTERTMRHQIQAATSQVAELLPQLESDGATRDHPVFRNVEWLGMLVHLDPVSHELLALAVMAERVSALGACLEMLAHSAAGNATRLHAGLAAMVGGTCTPDAVRAALTATGTLARAGLLTMSPYQSRINLQVFSIDERAEQVLSEEQESAELLFGKFIEIAPETDLTLADFPHAAEDVAILCGHLRRALRERIKGVNVLIYGPSGLGKTNLCRAISASLGASLFHVRVADDEGEALARKGRFSSFQLMQAILHDQPDALLLFDEVEDAFPTSFLPFGGSKPTHDKGWVNRLLEENSVPAFWLTNQIDQIDPAYLRRFDVVIELRVPPKRVRRRMLAKHLQGLQVTDDWLDTCASDDGVTPADMARAAKVAQAWATSAPSEIEDKIDRLLANQLLARRGPKAGAYRPTKTPYNIEYVNTDMDLRTLVPALRKTSRATACLFGAAGTGKTAFATWLADELDRPLLHKRASDLLGMYVGQTEANIANMFREAQQEQAVLLLDEADSFLRDRKTARQSWEVTQVNELLVQMEAFDGIFVCSTNLMDSLDEAAFRRFSWKIRFDALKPEQLAAVFLATLSELGCVATEGAEAAASRLHGITLGDVAAVSKRFQVLDAPPTAGELADALRGELAFRAPVRKTMGFMN